MINKIFEPKVLKYLLVGFLTVAIDYLFIFIVFNIFEVNYMMAIAIGFLMSNIFQFYMNFFYTFNLKRADMIVIKMVVFWIAVVIGNTLSFLLIVFLKLFISDVYIVKTLSLPLSFLYGYIVSNRVIYNDEFYIWLKYKNLGFR
jgi:putative flippase GtrA